MAPRKNTKTTGKSTQSSPSAKTDTVPSGSAHLFRTFIQRLCILSLLVVSSLLVYFVMGGDVQEVTGSRSPASSENSSPEPTPYSTAKPIMNDSGEVPLSYVSEGGTENGTEDAPPPVSEADSSPNPTSGATTPSESVPVPDSTTLPDPTVTPEPVPMPVQTPTPEPTVTPEPVPVPVQTPTPDPTVTPEPVPMPVRTPTPEPSQLQDSTSSIPQGSAISETAPATAPLKYNSETTIVGPDGHPRRWEVLILEQGVQAPVRNQFGPTVTDFLDLFDFSITPDWIEANWSTPAIVGPLTTRGYRVPISTGPTPSDLVGSLTYYFNSRLELEKITFEGYTGEMDRLLISLKYFNLSKRVTSDPNALLYVSEELADNRRSFLKTYYRLPNQTETSNQRFWITLELYPPER